MITQWAAQRGEMEAQVTENTAGTSSAAGTGGADAAAGGGRWVEVAPDRLARWVASFAERHGTITTVPGRLAVTFRAADGAAAECHPPFPPMAPPPGAPGRTTQRNWPG